MTKEHWTFITPRTYGRARLQIDYCIKQILSAGVTHVTFEVLTDEAIKLREKVKDLQREIRSLKGCPQYIIDEDFKE